MDDIWGVPDLQTCNLFATFPDRVSAGGAVQALRSAGLAGSSVSLSRRTDNAYVDEAEMRDEVDRFGTGRMQAVDPLDQKVGIGPAKTPEHAEGQIVVGVHTARLPELRRAEAILLARGPKRLDRVGAEGGVLSTEQTGLDSVPVLPGSGRHGEIG